MNTAGNQRFQETDRTIKQTALALLGEMPFEKISVRTICERSGCNRSTFYAHFLDIYDLMEKIQLDIYRDIETTFRDVPETKNAEFFHPELLAQMLGHIRKNAVFYRVYLSYGKRVTDPAGEELYARYMRLFLKTKGFSDTEGDERRMRYHFRFFFVGMVEVVRMWLDAGCPESPEELAGIIMESAAPYEGE